MQKLLNVVQEFMAWCGMQINVKETYLLVIDNDKKRRTSAALENDRETLQVMHLDDAYRYLGYWGTENGDVRTTNEVGRQKIIPARDLFNFHPLTSDLTTELFTNKDMGSSTSQWHSLSGLKVN